MSFAVVRARGLVTVQDLGRPGRMHEAVPVGGALVPARLIAANRTVQNPDGAAALEVLGELAIRATAPCIVATDVQPARALAAGAAWTVSSEPRRVTYVALRGGLAASLVLGGRGALLCAGLGGLVRAGEAFQPAGLPAVRAPDEADRDDDGPIRIVAGPDPAAFAADALAVLTAAPYRIEPTSNRVGTRLAGRAIPRTDAPEASRPMVLGAIEVPGDGQPIVLGPEHPTTGGYPIVAVVARADLGRLFSRRLGADVRFVRA
jgi:allophanate hydrolase subunit 2